MSAALPVRFPIEEYRQGLLDAGFGAVEIVDSHADLNAYAKIENQAGCCGPSMRCFADCQPVWLLRVDDDGPFTCHWGTRADVAQSAGRTFTPLRRERIRRQREGLCRQTETVTTPDAGNLLGCHAHGFAWAVCERRTDSHAHANAVGHWHAIRGNQIAFQPCELWSSNVDLHLAGLGVIALVVRSRPVPGLIPKAVNEKLREYITARCDGVRQNPTASAAGITRNRGLRPGENPSGRPARLTFVCTHNSRRSILCQVWGAAAAAYFGIPESRRFSGGTEATAFNSRAVAVLRRAGFEIDEPAPVKNPHYAVRYRSDGPALDCFSKIYTDARNPKADFCVVMTCAEADKKCPFVKARHCGSALPFDDPKAFDNTPQEAAMYDERCQQIARELLYVFSEACSRRVNKRVQRSAVVNEDSLPYISRVFESMNVEKHLTGVRRSIFAARNTAAPRSLRITSLATDDTTMSSSIAEALERWENGLRHARRARRFASGAFTGHAFRGLLAPSHRPFHRRAFGRSAGPRNATMRTGNQLLSLRLAGLGCASDGRVARAALALTQQVTRQWAAPKRSRPSRPLTERG